MKKITIISMAGLLVGLGCAGADDGARDVGGDAPSATEVATEGEVLAEVDLGYGVVQFVRYATDDGDAIVIGERSSAYLSTTPFEKLIESQPLTNLELFQAIAPGREPPKALVDQHPAHATLLGRDNADVVEASFDPDAVVEKSIAACEGFIYEPVSGWSWANRLGFNHVAAYNVLPVGRNQNDFDYWTASNVTLGVCNVGTRTMDIRMNHDVGRGWTHPSYHPLEPGWMHRWWNFTHTACCFGWLANRARYAVQAQGTSVIYHLRTAERRRN